MPDTLRGLITAAKEHCIVLMSKDACAVCPTLMQKFIYELVSSS